MKRIFAFLSITIAAMAPCACDFLEEENYTELSTETFFQDAKNVKYAVNGCYDILQKLAPQYVPCLETPTDYVCVSPDKKNAKETTWLNGVFTYSDERPSAVWEIAYMLIFNCNQVIDNIDAADLDDTLRERYIAEVRFLRGWSYLVLTNLFGDVPLRTTSKFGSSFSCELTPQSGIYDFLLEDLKYAEDHLYDFSYGRTLPDSKGLYKDNEHMRVSVDAALGMEALAYMYRAQNDAASPYWARARAKADSLITRYGGIDNAITGGWLSESYGSLFRGQTKYCRENLFSVYFDNGSKDDGSSLANNWAIYANYSKAANAGFRRFTNLWYQKHFKGHYDKRNVDGIMHEIVNAKGAKFIFPNKSEFAAEIGRNPLDGYSSALGAKPYGPWLSKYNDENAVTAGACETGINFLRYADVLLIFAECENEVNGPTADAYKALNKVRERAAAGDAPAGMTKDQFRTYVLEEREREFFGECKRFFDLNRREIYGEMVSQTQYNSAAGTGASEYDGVNRIRSYSKLVFAVPKDEIDANSALTL